MRRQRGVALLVVMALLVVLAGVVGGFALDAHVTALQASAQQQRLQLEQAAEGGIEAAAARLLAADPRRRPLPDGRVQVLDGGEGIRVEVRITDESGKLDLNIAEFTLIARFLQQFVPDAEEAAALAAAIVDWRDPDDLIGPAGGAEAREYRAAGLPWGPTNQPFGTVAELQRVLGMRPALFRSLRPYLTVHTGLPQPNPAFAERPLLLALGLPPAFVDELLAARAALQPGLPPPVLIGGFVLAAAGTGTYSISSRATRADGPGAEIHATVRVGAGGFLGQVYTPLSWRHGHQD